MKNQNGFVKGRLKSIVYAVRGTWILISTEHSVMVQSGIGVLIMALGFYFEITKMEWIFQIFAIGLVLAIEGLNTSIEKLCDYVQPNWHQQIMKVKDMAAGAVTFAALTAITIGIIIYYPYVIEKFFTR